MSSKTQSNEERIDAAQDWWNDERRDRYARLSDFAAKAEELYRKRSDVYLTSFTLFHAHAPNPHGINADKTPDDWFIKGSPDRVDNPELMRKILEELTQLNVTMRMKDSYMKGYYFLFEQ